MRLKGNESFAALKGLMSDSLDPVHSENINRPAFEHAGTNLIILIIIGHGIRILQNWSVLRWLRSECRCEKMENILKKNGRRGLLFETCYSDSNFLIPLIEINSIANVHSFIIVTLLVTLVKLFSQICYIAFIAVYHMYLCFFYNFSLVINSKISN